MNVIKKGLKLKLLGRSVIGAVLSWRHLEKSWKLIDKNFTLSDAEGSAKKLSGTWQIIKSISAREFFRLYPEIRKKYFWGGKLWTQSYFVETIGNASEDVIRKYVQDQLKVMNSGEKNSQQLGLF